VVLTHWRRIDRFQVVALVVIMVPAVVGKRRLVSSLVSRRPSAHQPKATESTEAAVLLSGDISMRSPREEAGHWRFSVY